MLQAEISRKLQGHRNCGCPFSLEMQHHQTSCSDCGQHSRTYDPAAEGELASGSNTLELRLCLSLDCCVHDCRRMCIGHASEGERWHAHSHIHQSLARAYVSAHTYAPCVLCNNNARIHWTCIDVCMRRYGCRHIGSSFNAYAFGDILK